MNNPDIIEIGLGFIVVDQIISVHVKLPELKWNWKPKYRFVSVQFTGGKRDIYCETLEDAVKLYEKIKKKITDRQR